MYNTRKELEEKVQELLHKVEKINQPKTGNVGILEMINHYIKSTNNTEYGFEGLKRCIVSMFYNQSWQDSEYLYPIHNKTAEKYSFTAYKLVKKEIEEKIHPLSTEDGNKIYAQIIESFLVELENKLNNIEVK